MPLPVYMLCSESGAEDTTTRRFSHFNVLEQVNISRLPETLKEKVLVVPSLAFQAVAVWEKEDSDDPDQEFEYRFVIRLPGSDEEIVANSGTFKFQARRQRLVLSAGGAMFQAVGLFRIECLLRPMGGEDNAWMKQKYSFPVVESPPKP